jgi:hypothetical protein
MAYMSQALVSLVVALVLWELWLVVSLSKVYLRLVFAVSDSFARWLSLARQIVMLEH